MRLWTLHPKYLDPVGLVALWRETLLAQKVLAGQTRGYRHHPQLIRFRESRRPLAAIGCFLDHVHREATARGYSFDGDLILERGRVPRIEETRGQLLYELEHLRAKLTRRNPERLATLPTSRPRAHPLFRIVPGEVRDWEKREPPARAPRRSRS